MGDNKKSVSPKKKSKKSMKCLKSDSSKTAISFEFVYYNDFWFNQKEFNQIENRLYLGTDIPIKERDTMDSLEVQHIISVTEESVPQKDRLEDINYIHVEAGDFPDQDLISHFDLCNKIIDSAHKNGEVVYVHCGGGVSRSATIVIAFIMNKYRIPYIDALRRVSKKRKVFPNDGFVEQLKLYERMQWFTDGFNEEYRRFLLKTLTYQLSTDGVSIKSSVKEFGDSRMRFDYETDCVRNYFEKIANAEQMAQSYRNLEVFDKGLPYCCYCCRTELFNEINIISRECVSPICHLFIEPLETYCTQSEGKKNGFLKCPNCLITFGTYNWLLYPADCTSHERYKECLALRASLSHLDIPI